MSSHEIKIAQTKILVVDDDEQLRLLFRYKLEEEGFHVVEAGSGEEAISVYQQTTPTMILMDAVMPGMDGFDACQNIFELATSEKPIVLMTTSLDDDKSVTRAYDAGAADYITKPIHWAVLTNRLKHLLKSHSAEQMEKKLELQQTQARKMAAIYRMVGGIAHDFNNLLTGIIGYSELALELTPDKASRLKKYLTEIDQAGSKAKMLIQKLLTFSQDTPSKPILTDPVQIVEESLTMIGESFSPTIEIETTISTSLPHVLVDPVHIYQAIINLCLNARQAMNNKGKLTISMHTSELPEHDCASCLEQFHGDFLEIAVADTGAGISDSDLSRIFDPFYSTHDMASGLGLSVVHGIVHEHHGHILVESKANVGSKFRIFLPLQ
ncbi:MAG: response regulator [Gammaproteobacteria bacterium]|nr:response regulator [Gammaproteobacteria bacterium]